MFHTIFRMEVTTNRNETVEFTYDGNTRASMVWDEIGNAVRFPMTKSVRCYARTREVEENGDVVSETDVTFFEWTRPTSVEYQETAAA
jgi:hypothetical protein